jgi:hypothetical protein
MQNKPSQQPILRELQDGLILRRSCAADAEALADFCARIHSNEGPDYPNPRVAAWVRDLLTKPHPTFHVDDFTIVAEEHTGRIVSTLNLIPQTWTYEGIPFGVGRPELVGTLPEYRNRGLVRQQFEEIHRWGPGRGQLVQAITGIPYYYRLFGYEMALDLSGRHYGFEANLPRLKEGETEPFHIRKASRADLPFVAAVYEQAQKRYAIACLRGMDIFEYELDVQSFANSDHFELMIIETQNGEPIGYFEHTAYLGFSGVSAVGYELKPGISWLEVSPQVSRYLWQAGQAYAERDKKECKAFGFMLGRQHPAYEALGTNILPATRDPYAWYIRVADLPGFVRHIAPALEDRLANSIAAGFSGELRLSFFRDGLRIRFEHGRLKEAGAWKPSPEEHESAAFPGLSFLQILFGYRSLAELEQSFADCYWMDWKARTLINILFPKKLSDVFPVA